MEKTRLSLQHRLEKLLGSRNVYFTPPSGLKMNYPCICYTLDNVQADAADNIKYMARKRYTLTVIDTNPDSVIPGKVLNLPYCSFDRTYRSDNLNHFVFTLFW